MEIQDILNTIDLRPFLYGSIQNSCTKELSDRDRLINIIIGVRGRNKFIYPCLDHLKKSIGDKSIVITIVEQDTTPNYQFICKHLGVDYIFVSNSSIPMGDKYNRSFCFNAGFLFTRESPWYLFHDIDMLVDKSFIENLIAYTNKNPRWLQPYTKKRVIRLNKEVTENICNNKASLADLVADRDYQEAAPGSTGGSILVGREAFIAVGGFDPELFYGYGPEDSFFWSKLEASEKEVGRMGYHFAGGGMFADDPTIEIYHMHHESMQDSNSDQPMMLNARETFWHSSYVDKLKVIEKKYDILKLFLR